MTNDERAREWLGSRDLLDGEDDRDVFSLAAVLAEAQLKEAETIRKEILWATDIKVPSGISSRTTNVLHWLDSHIAELKQQSLAQSVSSKERM